MASVELEHVTKRFGDFTAVRDLTLHVRDGEFLILVGPSGCGKTTTLRLIAGLETPNKGIVRIDGEIVNQVRPAARDVAMAFQSAGGLFPHMDAFSNIAFPLEMRKTPRHVIESTVTSTGGRMGLSGLLHRPPPKLSFGHRQQVALGRAIVRRPRVFLLDQPLGNLDATAQAEGRVQLQRLHRELRTTMIATTHDQTEAMALGDRLAVMRSGRLEQVGTPRALYDHPANLFVAAFVGSPPMNLVPVVMEGAVARASGFSVSLPRAVTVHEAMLGIRPEDLSDVLTPGSQVIEIRADRTEMVGPHQLIHGTVGSDRLLARVGRSFVVFRGDRVRLAVRTDRVHLFDRATGDAFF